MSYNKQTNGYKPKRTKVAESIKISVLPQISVQVRKGKIALGGTGYLAHKARWKIKLTEKKGRRKRVKTAEKTAKNGENH